MNVAKITRGIMCEIGLKQPKYEFKAGNKTQTIKKKGFQTKSTLAATAKISSSWLVVAVNFLSCLKTHPLKGLSTIPLRFLSQTRMFSLQGRKVGQE